LICGQVGLGETKLPKELGRKGLEENFYPRGLWSRWGKRARGELCPHLVHQALAAPSFYAGLSEIFEPQARAIGL